MIVWTIKDAIVLKAMRKIERDFDRLARRLEKAEKRAAKRKERR